MATKTINTELLAKMFLAGAASLEAKKEFINELNVFPVPDGDTGTNMTLTILSAAREVKSLINPDMQTLAKAISSGSLRGARGNSGVILSQLLRGFTKEIREHKEIDVPILARACERARLTAYKAVMKPKEGTILTVAKGIAHKAFELSETTEDLEIFIPGVLRYAEYVLSKTPEMLPVLKEAGVVDSGGQGLVEVLKGAYDAFLGKEIDYSAIETGADTGLVRPGSQMETNIRFCYCTEFIILTEKQFTREDESSFKAYLESIGDSIVCVSDEELVKIHLHTNDPGLVIQKALTFGDLSRIKIDNMREEHQEKLLKEMTKQISPLSLQGKGGKRKKVGFIAVSIGRGMNEIFKDLGADYIIEGGQTMNPSTEDMLRAIDAVNAQHIVILPNNKNIILAANQARSLTEDKDILVIPTKTVPQGITAIINYMPEADIHSNVRHMEEEIKRVKTGQVTYAVRDTKLDDKEIHEGDIMGIGDNQILAVGESVEGVAKELLHALADADTELISLYYGEDVLKADAERFVREIEKLYPQADVDAHQGGQPIYYYILSVE